MFLSVGSFLVLVVDIVAVFFVLFCHIYITRVGSDHLCCFPWHVGSQLTSHISLSVRLCRVSRCSWERFWQAGQYHFSYWFVFGQAIPMVGTAACAALKHTLIVVGFYSIRSFLAIWCLTDFAARILKILACSWNLACTYKGCFVWYWRAHFSSREQKRKVFSVGIRWLGGRGLDTVKSIAQIFVGVVFNSTSHLYDLCCHSSTTREGARTLQRTAKKHAHWGARLNNWYAW
jgi:hypothetical protein